MSDDDHLEFVRLVYRLRRAQIVAHRTYTVASNLDAVLLEGQVDEAIMRILDAVPPLEESGDVNP